MSSISFDVDTTKAVALLLLMVGFVVQWGVLSRAMKETLWWRWGPDKGRGLKGALVGEVVDVKEEEEVEVSSSSWMGGTVINSGNEGRLGAAFMVST